MKKGQMEYVTNHVHRKPGSLLPPQEELYNNHIDDMTQNHLELKPTVTSVYLARHLYKHYFKNRKFWIQEITQIKTYSDNYIADSKWLSTMQNQPSAVGIDSKGNIVVFHRADRYRVEIKLFTIFQPILCILSNIKIHWYFVLDLGLGDLILLDSTTVWLIPKPAPSKMLLLSYWTQQIVAWSTKVAKTCKSKNVKIKMYCAYAELFVLRL